MATLPLIITGRALGIYQVCTTANTDYRITVPTGATGCVLWFETSASSATMLGGRIGIDQTDTEVTGLTNTGTALGYHPAMPVEYDFETRGTQTVGDTTTNVGRDAYLHVACATALAVVRGMWLFDADA